MEETFSTLPRSLRVGVIRGGTSREYESSLETGDSVLKVLGETHRPLDIFISEDGKWHMGGLQRSPERILKNVDVVWNGLHGSPEEDGIVQEILEQHGIGFTGSRKYESAIAHNRWLAKEHAKILGIKTPVAMLVRKDEQIYSKAKEIFESLPNPLAVKPAKGGYAVAFYKVDSFHELLNALEHVLANNDAAIVEEYIVGKHATCGVLNGFRGKELYALPPSEYSDIAKDFVYPSSFSDREIAEIEKMAKKIHDGLGLRHYSSSDFVISPRRGIYFLEVSVSPKLSPRSAWLKSLEAVGLSLKDFLHHTVRLVLNKK